MIGRRAVVRRRPLLRTAAVGGAGYLAGRAGANRSAAYADSQADQDQRLSDLEYQQQSQQARQAEAPAQTGGGSPVMDQLSQLNALHQQGALTDAEFAAAKAQILGTSGR
jgi:membrane protease subunit (stomatin/prohibitin family)